MVKTTAANVYIDDTTTLAAKLTSLAADIAAKASSGDITTAVNTAVNNLKDELMGGEVAAAYDTFKEIADYISSHKDAADALNAAIGNKADKSVVDALQTTVDALGALATKSTVAESDLDDALKAKVNAASEGNHSHANKTVLDSMTADKVTAWDAKSKIYYSKTEPTSLGENDLWMQIVD